MSTAEGSILVKAPIGSVYRQWVRVEDFPKFMTALKNAKKADANHFFITIAHNGQRYEGVLEIMLRVPERRRGQDVAQQVPREFDAARTDEDDPRHRFSAGFTH